MVKEDLQEDSFERNYKISMFLLILTCNLKSIRSPYRLAGPGRQIFILEITGSNPVGVTKTSFINLAYIYRDVPAFGLIC